MLTNLMNKYSDLISQVETELLLSSIFRCSREELYINNMIIDREIEALYDSLIQRRLSGEPLQYITGSSRFMGLDFFVTRDVFIPRPETEDLVNEVLLCKKDNPKILDLCTGCGNIAVSLAHLIDQTGIVATDISGPALEIAYKNSVIHKLDERVRFYKGDLFAALPLDKKYKFDIIVCNPPYIKDCEIEGLQKELGSEPRIALDGGPTGLEFYRRIRRSCSDYLEKDGSLFLEIGYGQIEAVKEIFARDIYKIRKVTKDFRGIERVIWIGLS